MIGRIVERKKEIKGWGWYSGIKNVRVRWQERDGNKFHQVLFAPTGQVSPIINQASISIWSNCRVIGLLHERTVNTTKKKRWARVKVMEGERGKQERRKKKGKQENLLFLSSSLLFFLRISFSLSPLVTVSLLPFIDAFIIATSCPCILIHLSYEPFTMNHMLDDGCNDLFQVTSVTNYNINE